jgi:hypothetical protein
MLGGVVGGVYYFYNLSVAQNNPCGAPTTPTFSKAYAITAGNGQQWEGVNATFTGFQQENFQLLGVSFVTLAFNDPSLPHLIGGACGTDSSTPATITLQVTFSKDGAVEDLKQLSFKGTTPGAYAYQCSTHVNPQACVVWYTKDPYVILQVSTT